MVGLFFYIDKNFGGWDLNFQGFLTHAIDEKHAEKCPNGLNDPLGHDKLFDMQFGLLDDVEYFDFPRGRVVYDERAGEHIIYIDKCIQTSENIDELKRIFGLQNCKCRVDNDVHYVCKKCGKKMRF